MSECFKRFILPLSLLVSLNATGDIKSIRDIKHSLEGMRVSTPFTLSGQVIGTSGNCFILSDATGSAQIRNETIPRIDLRAGDMIRARGYCRQSRMRTLRQYASRIEITGHSTLPPPMEIDAALICSEMLTNRQISTSGVITSATPDESDASIIWFRVRTIRTTFSAYTKTNHYNLAYLNGLVDAEVRLTGTLWDFSDWSTVPGSRYLVLEEPNAITIIKPAPENPFDASPLSLVHAPHRQRITGTVVASGDSGFFIQTEKGDIHLHFIKPRTGAKPPRSGETITVVGFAEIDRGRITLRDAFFRKASRIPPLVEVPRQVPFSSFFSSEQEQRSFVLTHGMLLKTHAKVERMPSSGALPTCMILEQDGNRIFVDTSALPKSSCDKVRPGCVLEVTGYVVADFEGTASHDNSLSFNKFIFLPRTPTDLRVLTNPPWWTPFRLATLAIALGTTLLFLVLWNVMLKRKSENRGKELYEEKIDHALAEQKVEERTRLAIELHDSVSQALTGVALQLDGGEVETAKTMLASCRGELRRCLWDLRSRTFEEKDMTEAVTRTITPHLNGCTATVRFNVPRERLSESLTHAILRIIRELVVNAIRHGQAQHIKIAGEMHENTVSFSVLDNGCGFDPANAPGPARGHFGILGIRERIESFNGELKIEASPGHGSKFTMTLKASDESNEQ